MNFVRFAKKPGTGFVPQPTQSTAPEASNSLTDSFYAEEFGEGTAPGQIFADGMIKFQQAAEGNEDGKVLDHDQPKLEGSVVRRGIAPTIVVELIAKEYTNGSKRSEEDELHGKRLALQQDGVSHCTRTFVWVGKAAPKQPKGWLEMVSVLC